MKKLFKICFNIVTTAKYKARMVTKMEIKTKIANVSRLRSISSQIIASMSSFLLLLDIGMAVNFPTIMIPALLNAKEGLSLDETQASWFGSISFLTQPAGALLSGPIVDYLGRRKANFISNIPMAVAWLLMYFSWNLPSLFTGNALLGFSTGIMEAPISSYVGETSEPSIRGALCTGTQFFTSLGILIVYFFGTVVDWRIAALICLLIPAISMIMVIFTPESPVWLLANNREENALKSLCKLRGWTIPENVQEEFDELKAYNRTMQQCVICYSTKQDFDKCEHKSMHCIIRNILYFRYVMLCKETLRPLAFVMTYFFFYVMSGLIPIRPNLVNVCGALGMAEDGKQIVLMSGVITFATSLIVIGLVKVLGKRKIAISALLGCALSCLTLSIYARENLDPSVFSYKPSTFPTQTSVIPLIALYMLTIFTGLCIPWVLLSEVFPFRSRAVAQGISAASNYVFFFIGSKTVINLEIDFSLWGTFAIYAAIGFLGALFLYFFLPETEGKSLQEIETYYSGDLRIFADDPIINSVKRLKGSL